MNRIDMNIDLYVYEVSIKYLKLNYDLIIFIVKLKSFFLSKRECD